MLNKDKKIFKGDSAVLDFLKPDGIGFTPLVELPNSINPFTKDKVRIFVKMIQLVPLFNIKSLPAYGMLSDIPKNELKNIKNLIEYSSGNTVLSLSIYSQYFGIPNMYAIITPDVPSHKKRLLQIVGANLLISNGPASPDVFANVGGVYDAKQMGNKKGWHNLNQYVNEGSQKASMKYIGQELWEQLGKDLNIFTSSIGTGGTIVGSGLFLKEKNKNIFILGTAIKKGSSIPGPRGEAAIDKLAMPWKKITNEVISIGARDSYKYSLDLIRLGLFVGPSTGMQLAALLKKIQKLKKEKKLDNFRNKKGEIVCSLLACDTMYPYIDDYFSNLPKSYFPKIRNL
jgi:cysteine synthase